MKRNPGCLPAFMGGLLLALIVIAFMGVSRANQRTSTVERVLQPQASVQLEAQQLAAEGAQAQLDATRTERRDWLLFVAALALAGMGALVLIAWLVTRRPQIVEQRVTLQLPPDTPEHYIDAAWRIIDADKERADYQLTETRRR